MNQKKPVHPDLIQGGRGGRAISLREGGRKKGEKCLYAYRAFRSPRRRH